MPALLAAPWLATLIAGIGTAATVGTTAYELANQPGGASQADLNQQKQQQAAAQAAQAKAAVLANQGNTQAATGGSLTPAGFAQMTAKNAGAPSDLNSILSYLGGGANNAPISGGTTGANSGQSGQNLQQLSDLITTPGS